MFENDTNIGEYYTRAAERRSEYNQHLQNARAAYKTKRYGYAVECYTKAMEFDADDPHSLCYERGRASFAANDFNGAISNFTQAIAINRCDEYAYFFRGLAYYNQGKFTDAISDFTQVIAIAPNRGSGYGYRGIANYQEKRFAEAVLDCAKAIELEPQHEEFNRYLDHFLQKLDVLGEIQKCSTNEEREFLEKILDSNTALGEKFQAQEHVAFLERARKRYDVLINDKAKEEKTAIISCQETGQTFFQNEPKKNSYEGHIALSKDVNRPKR